MGGRMLVYCANPIPVASYPPPSCGLSPQPFHLSAAAFSPKPNRSPGVSFPSLPPHRPFLWPSTSPAATVEAVETLGCAAGATEDGDENQEEKERLGVVVNVMEKPRLVLKFMWMEKSNGHAVDQVIPGHGTVPLSPYYFLLRKLKSLLEGKPWFSQKRMIILRNQATDIINLWQQSGGNLQPFWNCHSLFVAFS